MTDEPTPAAPAQPPNEKGVADIIVPVLGAVGTGISVIGFVVFFGGMVEWARYDALGVPANSAVARVTRPELVATGAHFLVPAVLAALGAVAVSGTIAYLGSLRWISERQHRFRDARADAQAKVLAARERIAAAATALTAAQTEVETWRDTYDKLQPGPSRDTASAELKKAESKREAAEKENQSAETALAQALKADADAAAELERAGHWTARDRLLILGSSALVFIAVAILVAHPFDLNDPANASLVLSVAVGGTAIAAIILDATHQWGWFAVLGFLAVGITLAAGTFFRTHDYPKSSPVAVIRSGGPPVAGLMVTRTDDSALVLVPAVNTAKDAIVAANSATVEVPKAKTLDMAVGAEVSTVRAYRRALELGLGLCARPKPPSDEKAATASEEKKKAKGKKSGSSGTAPEKQCDKEQTAALERSLKTARQLPVETG